MRNGLLKASAVAFASTLMIGACSTGASDQAEVSTGKTSVTGSPTENTSDTSQATESQPISDATSATCEKVSSGHVDVELQVSGLSGPGVDSGAGSLTFVADFDLKTERADATLDMSGMSGLMTSFEGLPTPGSTVDPAAAISDPVHIIVDGNSIYVNWPFASEMANAQTPWVQFVAPDDVADHDSMPMIDIFDGLDPCDVMGMLDAMGAGVTSQGTEQIDGIETDHYSGVVNLGAMITKMVDDFVPSDGTADVDEKLDEFADAMKIPLDVWVGEDGVLRRLVVDYDLSSIGMGVSGKTTLTVNLTNVGQSVEISAPSADQVTVFDLESILGDMPPVFGLPGFPQMGEMPNFD